MDTDSIYGRTFECECGRTHKVQPHQVVYADDAVAQLPRICADWTNERRAAVLMDVRTRRVAGEAAATALADAGWEVTRIVVPDADGRWPVCDRATRDSLTGPAAGAGIIVPVGSGVISDLGKWLAFDMALPYVAFATAASMNGYASANVALTVEGVKTLFHARPPLAVAASPSVLAEAPYEMR